VRVFKALNQTFLFDVIQKVIIINITGVIDRIFLLNFSDGFFQFPKCFDIIAKALLPAYILRIHLFIYLNLLIAPE